MVDWVTAMDMCASAGIINYDAPAAILGVEPRYVGHPDFATLPSLNGPLTDTYDTNNGNIIRPKGWKKKLFGFIIGAGSFAAALALLSKTGKFNTSALKNFGSSVLNAIKKPFVWLAGKLKPRTTPPAP